ncbi:hypothetical protein ACFQLX_17805 [Streptomyces polyrhachis]|uniref:Uncharacterized protein n=1 Tax=Streptomyces polyrhachis TaxID=1282885 RepID=A0ABW2GLQ6_9ACTN
MDGQVLGRGVRLFGTGCCVLLALPSLLWIARDLAAAGSPAPVWWGWAGAAAPDAVQVSSLYDPVLVLVCAVAAAAVPHSRAAAGILGSVAAAAVALRVPALWTLNGTASPGALDSELRNRVLLSAGGAATLAAVLLIAVAAGRRPAGAGAGRGRRRQLPPPAPGDGAAFTASLLLSAAAAGLAGWAVHDALGAGWARYVRELTGDGIAGPLLGPPPAYGAWCAVAWCLTAAAAALLRAPLSRPLGMTAAALVLGRGVAETSVALRERAFADFGALPFSRAVEVAAGPALLSAAFAVLWALAGQRAHGVAAEPLRSRVPPPAPSSEASEDPNW